MNYVLVFAQPCYRRPVLKGMFAACLCYGKERRKSQTLFASVQIRGILLDRGVRTGSADLTVSMLEQLTDDHRAILISLPYRVGVWVSQSDSKGGAQADTKELKALSNIIHGFVSEMFGSELVQEIMTLTVQSEGQWEQWAGQISSVPGDCRIDVDILVQYGDAKDVNAYAVYLMQIGEAVAMAFRERHHISFVGKIVLYWHYARKRAQAAKAGQDYKNFEEFFNVSVSERRALETLAGALGTIYF